MADRNIETTVECFVEKDGKYLMLRRHPDKRILPNILMAPGGHQEFCEGVVAATRREIKEETGLDICDVRIRVAGIAYLKAINQEFAFHVLTAKYAGGQVISNPADGELVWLSRDEMIGLDNILGELKPLIPLILNDDNDYRTLSVRAVYEKGNELTEFEIEKPD